MPIEQKYMNYFCVISSSNRRMFPSVRVKVRNLDPCQQYYIAMDVMPVDSKRYRCVLRIIIILIMMIKNLKCHSLPAALLTHARVPGLQVRVPQLAVDGRREHGPLLHLAQALRAPGLSVRGRDVDASGDQLRPGQAHQQRNGRQGSCR